MSEHPRASVVVAVLDEADNIDAVIAEVLAAFTPAMPFELVFVDDGSRDATAARITEHARANGRIRLVRHAARTGKSQAVRTGVLAARAEWVATMDGDGQNDPADLVTMLTAGFAATPVGAPGRAPLVAGIRVRRDDPWARRVATRFANRLRAAVLGDRCPDTACGMKVFRRDDFLLLPCFEGMHRFLPALFQRYGAPLINQPVAHRARLKGQSKYTNWGRALVGIADMFGVMWLVRRTTPPTLLPEAQIEAIPEARKGSHAGP